MVDWICQYCKNYNDKMSFPGLKPKCDHCGQARTIPLPSQARPPAPTPAQTEEMLRQELIKTPPPPPPLPLPTQYEEPPIRDEDLRDPRCKLGAHVCRYCNEGFLVTQESIEAMAEFPEELRKGKKK